MNRIEVNHAPVQLSTRPKKTAPFPERQVSTAKGPAKRVRRFQPNGATSPQLVGANSQVQEPLQISQHLSQESTHNGSKKFKDTDYIM